MTYIQQFLFNGIWRNSECECDTEPPASIRIDGKELRMVAQYSSGKRDPITGERMRTCLYTPRPCELEREVKSKKVSTVMDAVNAMLADCRVTNIAPVRVTMELVSATQSYKIKMMGVKNNE